MEFTSWFMRTSVSGKCVGVLKYRDGEGRWRQLTRTFTEDMAESELMFADWRRAMGIREGSPETVGQLVSEVLEGQLARGLIERSTYEAQLGYAHTHIMPDIGAEPVSSLTPRRVEEWLASLGSSLSPSSARIAYGILRKACRRAVRDGLIERSPLDLVDPPRVPAPRSAHLDAAAREALAKCVLAEWGAGSGRALAVALGLYAGLRCGECCGLRWRDVDLTVGRLRVRSAIGRCVGGGYAKGPKNASSAREFPVVGELADALRVRRERVGSREGRVDSSWFVCGDRGAFTNPKALSRDFARLCEKNGVRDSLGGRATFHTLRHTFATVAVLSGVDVRTLSDLLGHAAADITLNVYASSNEDAKRMGVARLERAFG